MKEISKMEKRGNELVARNKAIVAEVGEIDKQVKQAVDYKQTLVNELLENNGAIKLVNSFLNVTIEKNKDAVVAEIKKEEKKETNKEKK